MQELVYRRYGRPDSIVLHDVPTPAIGDDQVLVRQRATSINAGDWHFLRGRPFLIRATAGLRRPKDGRMGVDVAGVVEAVGPSVDRFAPGDEVYGMVPTGAMAEYVAARDWIAPKPPSLTFEQAAAIPSAGCTALQALRDHGHVQAGERVLVYGAGGGVGTFAVQIAAAMGSEVTALTTTSKVTLMRSLGADAVVDYRHEDIGASGRRFDLVVDIGATRSFRELRRLLVSDGRIVGVGAGRGLAGPIGRFAAAALRARVLRQRITSFIAGPPFEENLTTLTTMIGQGAVRPIVDRTYPLARTAEAIERFASGDVPGKLVITLS